MRLKGASLNKIMEIQSAISFVVGSILFSVGFLILSAMIVAVNNLFSKYWKPIKWQTYHPADFTVVDHETIEELKKTMARHKAENK
jgi:hypothetical protein